MTDRAATEAGDLAPLTLAISDFWSTFDPGKPNFLLTTLARRWRVELDDGASLLAFGPYGRNHVGSRATKVYCSGEPFAYPSRLGFDYSLSWHLEDHERHTRLVHAVWGPLSFPDVSGSVPARSFDEWAERPYFCNFVYENGAPSERRELFAALSRRRFVHAPGSVGRNTEPIPGGRWAYDWWPRKLDYLRQFRFTIAFENASFPGYTTEKGADALIAGTVPIYWGNPEVGLDLDPGSLVDARSFRSADELADYIVELDDDRALARPLFENPSPLRFDVEQARDSIIGVFERAAGERGLARRALRSSRPTLHATASSLRRLRQGRL